jgi:hypothetical protein
MKRVGQCLALSCLALTVQLAAPGAPAAAAETSPTKTMGEPKDDQALVYFIREARFQGGGRTMFLYADDIFLGTLDNNSYTFAYVPPGKHLLWLNWARINAEVELAAGKVYYFNVWDKIRDVDEEFGKTLIGAVKSYSTPTPKEQQTSAEHISERYGKAQKVAAKKPADQPDLAGSKQAREEHIAEWPRVDLAPYTVLVIEDFEMADPKAAERPKEYLVQSAGRRLAEQVAKNVGEGAFAEVRRGAAAEPVAGGVVLKAKITQYKPGSEMARLMVAGAGSVQLELEARLVDAATGQEITHFAADRTWAWGGALGVSRGIEEMERNLAYELATYLRRSKGAPDPGEPAGGAHEDRGPREPQE